MNRVIARALLLDAWHQVADNKVFRLLVLGCLAVVALTFVVGFREDGLSLFFGWQTFRYEDFAGGLRRSGLDSVDLRVPMIQGLQALMVEKFAGLFGIFVCIAATASFVPRILEKGAADILFTKPISRVALLLSRYVAGLVFVGILSFLLILGIHVGLLVGSGYSDPAFLWSALTLLYIYALVQTVSVLVGILTRSGVASIICALIFFPFNGCIHGVWVGSQWGAAHLAAGTDEDAAMAAQVLDEQPLLKVLRFSLDFLHYTLPKTGDADVITRQVRTIIVGSDSLLEDEAGGIAVARNPEGFELESPGGTVDLMQSPAVWSRKLSDGSPIGSITLSRRSRLIELPGRPKPQRKVVSQIALEFLKSLEDETGVVGKPARESMRTEVLNYERIRWSQEVPKGRLYRERVFFGIDDWVYELDASVAASEAPDDQHDARTRRFMRGVRSTHKDSTLRGPEEWYEDKFGWTSPLKFNAFFSIGSSLVFALAMLAAATWRLSRMDL